jgi:hypothetical protein
VIGIRAGKIRVEFCLMEDQTGPRVTVCLSKTEKMGRSLCRGPLNAINHVAGVNVGQTIIILGGNIRPGVTAIRTSVSCGQAAVCIGRRASRHFRCRPWEHLDKAYGSACGRLRQGPLTPPIGS